MCTMRIHGWHLIMTAMLASKAVAGGVVFDLGHGYHNQSTTCWSPAKRFETYEAKIGMGPNGWYATESFSMNEHCGTHLDAPYHFHRDGWKLDEIPLERMIAEGVYVDVSDRVDGNGSFLLTADHLRAWEHANGPLPNRSVILVSFGWAHRFGDRRQYYHDGADGTSLRFPGLATDAAQWIVDSGRVYGLGVDGPSVDPGGSASFDVHRVLAEANVYGLENVALNGTALPPKGFKLIVQPIKIVGGTGGPCRILAFANDAFEQTDFPGGK